MKLQTQMVEKPWGRGDIAAAFAAPAGKRIGEIWFDAGGAPLPLLIKWLFTSDKLSVQVHPNDAQARARGAPSGQEECWYIVEAKPGACLGIGVKQPLNAEQLRAAAISGAIEDMMDWKPVQAGDYYYIPAGTVHAIGAGITLVEVQQNADITYRLYDYGRLDNGALRTLHLDDGVAVSKPGPYSDARSGQAVASKQLVDAPFFRLWLADGTPSWPSLTDAEKCWIIPISGHVTIDNERANVGECYYINAEIPVIFGPASQALIAAEISA